MRRGPSRVDSFSSMFVLIGGLEILKTKVVSLAYSRPRGHLAHEPGVEYAGCP